MRRSRSWSTCGLLLLLSAAGCRAYDEQLLQRANAFVNAGAEADGGAGRSRAVARGGGAGDAGADSSGAGGVGGANASGAGAGGAGSAGGAGANGSDASIGLDGEAGSPGGGGEDAGSGAPAAGSGGMTGSAALGSSGTGASGTGASGAGASGAGAGRAGASGAGVSGAGAGASGAGAGGSAAGSGGTAGGGASCPEPGGSVWIENGHCYFPLAGPATWNVSRDTCSGAGAQLVTITSADEQAFAAALVGGTTRWIGLSRFGAPSFSWLAGEALTYTNWDTGEPNQSGEAAAAIATGTLKWIDEAVTSSHGAICERD
jgi:Lectin C-type domain